MGLRYRPSPPIIFRGTPPWILVGKSFGERFSVSVNALNVANSHLLIDNSFTFGGLHFNDPREVYGRVALPLPLLIVDRVRRRSKRAIDSNSRPPGAVSCGYYVSSALARAV